jgi:hypothetical protein
MERENNSHKGNEKVEQQPKGQTERLNNSHKGNGKGEQQPQGQRKG